MTEKDTFNLLEEIWLNPEDTIYDKYPDIVDEVNQNLEDNFKELFLDIVFDYPLPKTYDILLKIASNDDIDNSEMINMSKELQEIYRKELKKYLLKNFNELFNSKIKNINN